MNRVEETNPGPLLIKGRTLHQVLSAHTAWLEHRPGGARADLSEAMLSELDLSGVNLREANLVGATLVRTLEGHTNWVRAVAITPDGQRAVSASDDRTLRIWDLATGATLRTLEGHTGPVSAVAITPDGQRAVSASDDGTLRI